MTAEFEPKPYISPVQGRLTAYKTGYTNQSIGAIDMLKRDRFELLSAYLDGEVTAAERRQVEDWLVNDPEIQRLYGRLLKLRQGLRTMPVPREGQPVECTIQQVFARLDHRPKKARVWRGAAVAALFVGALLGVLPSSHSPSRQIAQSQQQSVLSEDVMVALNIPVVEIPKAAVAPPERVPQRADSSQRNHRL